MITLIDKCNSSTDDFQVTVKEVDQVSIKTELNRRAMRFEGSSFILNFQDSEMHQILSILQTELCDLFEGKFQRAAFVHSTLMSHKLDPKDQNKDQKLSQSEFREDGLSKIEKFFKNKDFMMSFKRALIAENINIILQNEMELPILKRFIAGLGAMIKDETMEGPKLATTGLVLGWFTEVVSNESIFEGKQIILDFLKKMSSKCILVQGFELIQYEDVSLVKRFKLKNFIS